MASLKDNVDLTFAILKINHFKGFAKNIKGLAYSCESQAG
jgi:hypothetical protein